jgi:integrase
LLTGEGEPAGDRARCAGTQWAEQAHTNLNFGRARTIRTSLSASVLLAQGDSVVAVAERLGHHNAALVLSTYGHLMPDSEDRTRRAVDSAWAACAPSVPHEEGVGR